MLHFVLLGTSYNREGPLMAETGHCLHRPLENTPEQQSPSTVTGFLMLGD